jgi:hypothetical protein
MDVIINWFILIIIFVFDPLAVALVIAFSNAVQVDRGIVKKEKVLRKRKLYDELDDSDDSHTDNQFETDWDDMDEDGGWSDEDFLSEDELSNLETFPKTEDEFNEADLDKDGVVSEEERREFYETIGWSNSHKGDPYYLHPWFDWNKKERWINDRNAINYWLTVKGGTQSSLNKIQASTQSKYPDNFDKKTY